MLKFTIYFALLLVLHSCKGSQDEVTDILEVLSEIDDRMEEDSTVFHNHRSESSHHSRVLHVVKDLNCRVNGKINCSLDCLHGKLSFGDGCCQCRCKKNYAAISSTKCRRVSWSSWSTWSECIKTGWGGLQLKERLCRSNGREAPGACVGRGSLSRTCTDVIKDFRIRKNVHDLSDEELHDLIQAITKFKKDTSKNGYRNIISWHGYPGRCPWYHSIEGHEDNHCSWHHHPLFLPWHRMIMVQLELGLQRYLKNKTLGIPFWDWTEHALDIPYLVRHPEIYDPIHKKYVYNPFFRTFITKTSNHTNLYSHRNIYYPRVLSDEYLRKGSVRSLLSHDYFHFDQNLAYNPHDQIHNCFCYKSPRNDEHWCLYGMPTVQFAAWDPVFLLHHSAMDRIFSMRRHLEESLGVSDWTRGRIVGEYLRGWPKHSRTVAESFDWPLAPFSNKTMNPQSVTGKNKVWTLHRSYYHEQLFGYKYDNFDFGNGYLWKDLKDDFKRHNEKFAYWDDREFETKMGRITEHSICPNVRQISNNCVLSC